MAKRKRLKKQVYYFIIIIIIMIFGIVYGYKQYQEYKYKQTDEYKLLEKGYNKTDVKTLLDNFSDISYFLEQEVNQEYVKLVKEKYYLSKNFDKYIEYMQNNTYSSLAEVVRIINVHLDKDFYEDTLSTNTSLDTLMLVNKYYILSSDYEPDDLVSISSKYSWGSEQRVRKVVYDAFLSMWESAYSEGYYLMVSSSYRSYAEQEIVYNNYKKKGTKYADSIAARAGSSEHQTGLTLDIFSKTNSSKSTFEGSEESNWLANNSYKYGFILRYPEDKVDITGYNYESWHFRYVGVDVATYIYENNITFDEYYAYFLEK